MITLLQLNKMLIELLLNSTCVFPITNLDLTSITNKNAFDNKSELVVTNFVEFLHKNNLEVLAEK